MDDSVGKVVARLSGKNMLENSIIVFFSDNGAQNDGLFQNFASNWPLRGVSSKFHSLIFSYSLISGEIVSISTILQICSTI